MPIRLAGLSCAANLAGVHLSRLALTDFRSYAAADLRWRRA